MLKIKSILVLLITTYTFLSANTYFVAVNGDDDNPGTIDEPLNSWQKAFDMAQAGDTIYIRGGVYYSSEPALIDISGTKSDPIFIAGYPQDILQNNWPVLDCYKHCENWTNPWDFYNSAIMLDKVQYIHLKNLEIRNVYQCDTVLSGAITALNTANITYEELRVHEVGERGYWHQSGAWNRYDSLYAVDVSGKSPETATPVFQQPDTTRWINCDTWNICDTLAHNDPGNGGDGWKVISYVGNYYYWEGCRAWNYSDDGFDPNKGERVFVNCWAMASNKYNEFGIEGNGFKSSAWRKDSDTAYYFITDPVSKRLVKQKGCLAMFCPGVGFYHGVESDSTDNAYWVNNTAYKCGRGFTSRALGLDSIGDIFRNNIAYASTSLTATDIPYDLAVLTKYDLSNNTWEWESSYPNFVNRNIVSDDDFEIVDSLALVSIFTASRQPDGSLPARKPLQLKSTSDLIDAGTVIPESDHVNFTLSYFGKNPDIGYSEYTAQALIQISDYFLDQTAVNTTVVYYSSLAGNIDITVLNSSNVKVTSMNHTAFAGDSNTVNIDMSDLENDLYTIRLSYDQASDSCIVAKRTPDIMSAPEEINNIRSFPNPTNGSVIVDLGTSLKYVTLTLYDINGRFIKEYSFNNRQTIEVNIEEPAGIYFLKILSENKTDVIRVIKY